MDSEGPEVHSQLHGEFKVSLGYMKSCLKKNKKSFANYLKSHKSWKNWLELRKYFKFIKETFGDIEINVFAFETGSQNVAKAEFRLTK